MLSRLDVTAGGVLADGPMAPRRAVAWRWLVIASVLASVGFASLRTVPEALLADGFIFAEAAAMAMLTADYLLRLRLAWIRGEAQPDGQWKSLAAYAGSIYGVFDVIAALPLLAGWAVPVPQDVSTVLAIAGFLKLARYSTALETLGAVLLREVRPLLAALFIILLLAIVAATLLYFAERQTNPAFASVPHALWWSIVTLATVGYGDVVPITALGKAMGAAVAVLGLCMFALPASILASGFAEEMRRHNFLSTWQLVSRVPLFAQLHAGQIAEIASLLKPLRAQKGDVILREGELGDLIYFIVSGRVEGNSTAGTFVLKAGDFFGEIAIIERRRRTATVRAVSRSQFLVLDARDLQKFGSAHPELMKVIRETAKTRLSQVEDTQHSFQWTS